MGNERSKEEILKKAGALGHRREDANLYKLVDLHGGGELIPWMRFAERTGDHSIIDSYIEVKVAEFLYNQGKGKLMTVTELVKIRNKERNAMLGAFSRKKGKGKSGPNVLDEFNQEGENVGDLKKALKLLDGGGGKGGKNETKYREMCWRVEERGTMGETLIGVCLMATSELHNKLICKLLDAYPKLVNDISITEDYYGLSPLHQAVVNQDIPMVASLLRRGADVNQRCYGAFFCAEDQKASRSDSLEHEYVELALKTNYTGNMYFGEYPLSFAACMDHPDCFRLLIAYKANPNAKDTNGNTVLHMCVIHEHLEMFRLAVEKGASLKITNKQNLTPLTLAAKLAKKQMFHEILAMEAGIQWEYGGAKQTAYPLGSIDTITEDTGENNDDSALGLVAYGETPEHLDLLDGLLLALCEAKWDSFAKKKWLLSLGASVIYFFVATLAFMTRPYSLTTDEITNGTTRNFYDLRLIDYNAVYHQDNFDQMKAQCHLVRYHSLPWYHGYMRLVAELLQLALLAVQTALDVRDIRRLGYRRYVMVTRAFPEKMLYKVSSLFVLLVIPCRAFCSLHEFFLAADNILSILALLLITFHFLYFMRALKLVGPFVLMIFTIITTDIVRFLFIYSMFLMGFSQAFYLVFLGCERKAKHDNVKFDNVIASPTEALIRTFIASKGSFLSFYKVIDVCPAETTKFIGKALFIFLELFVALLQINMLIAMMAYAYERIFHRRREWKRQWAQVILMVELSLSPEERLRHLLSYSRPTGTNKKERCYVVNKKLVDDQMEDFERRARAEHDATVKEQHKFILKRKRVDKEIREGNRPVTAFRRPSTIDV